MSDAGGGGGRRTPANIALIVLSIAAIGVLVTSIVLASLDQGLMAGLEHLWSNRWGVTTLIDLYIGLALIGAWIALIERRPLRWLPWVVALALTGNLATAMYVLVRALRTRSAREALLPPA